MAKFCGKCGSALNGAAAFCGGCGARVPMAPPAAAIVTPVQGTYTPPPSNPSSVPEQPGFAPVPSSFPTVDTPPADPTAFTSVPGIFTPVPPPSLREAPVPAPQPGGYAPVQPAYSPVAPSYPPAPVSYTPAPAAYAPANAYPTAGGKKSNTLLKIIVALVLILFVGGALALGGLWYAAEKIKEKAHAVAAQALGGNSAASGGLGQLLGGVAGLKADDDAAGFKGDPCRFLSKAEVSQAIGIQVIRTESGGDGGCNYIAHGDPADATAKHMSSMIGGMGADAKTQKQIQKLAGGFFAQQEAGDKDLRAQAATGEIPVLVTRYTSGNAQAEMKMNRGGFTYVTGGAGTASNSGSGDLDGIGDEAYLAGGSMLIFRKGNSVAHFTYISCPCNTDNIKPLARLVASRL